MSKRRLLNKNLNFKNLKKKETALPEQIIYAWNYIEWGGAQIYFFGLISRIKDKTGIKIILPRKSNEQLITFIENLDVKYEFFDGQTDVAPVYSVKRKLQRHYNKFQAELAMIRHIESFDLQNSIVHVELAPWQSLYSLLRLCRQTKVFITMHNSLPPVPKWRYLLWKYKFRIITKIKNFHIFASNQDAKESLKPLVPKKFYDDIKVTYTNVNPEEIEKALKIEIDRAALLQKHQIPKDKFLVFCVGQFIDRKGRWTFLEAVQKASEKDKNIAFVWISNSMPSTEDLEKAAKYGLNENFIFITSEQVGKEHIDLFKLLRLADIFALVSFQEGLPISLLEAMALGIPSISTNVNAIPEAVKHLKTGWLIEAGDVQNLTKAILELKNNGDLREKLSKNGREFVLEHFNEKVVASIAEKEYAKSFSQK